uniref:Uncharacterized protein n=1 Tax=Nucleocytoviricota sp. TaxID=2809609 RepID=A0A9E8G473_9VIRU|nr:hypothetical protein [Nucleocytoviricota sp.]UZT29059.1 hypothetical protein [Nucleocytoviricota sp.]
MNFTFVIYSCKKNLNNAEKIYNIINNKILNSKIYILYSDKHQSENYKIIDDKYIILNVDDDYDHLCDKTLQLIKLFNVLFPSSNGLFKCDDDVIVNLKQLNIFIKLLEIKNYNYCGNIAVRTKQLNYMYKLKGIDKYETYECTYCRGPLYYISKNAIQTFHKDVLNIYYEDMLIGYHLNKNNIYPEQNIKLFTDIVHESSKISYHNINHHNKLYLIIFNGLGNQLFQISSALYFSKKHNKEFIINPNLIIPNNHQQKNINETISKILKIFPNIKIDNSQINQRDYIIYKEPTNENFQFMEAKINNFIETYNNIILHGQFINYNYLQLDIFNNIKYEPINKNLIKLDYTNLYFIHIRLGDFLLKQHNINFIDLKNYYNYCINNILIKNKNAKFIICTNQYDNILKEYIDNINCDFKYILQDKNDCDIDTLYIMSNCKGGITSNSTLSYMGIIINKNEKNNNNFYMPYPFVKLINEFNKENVNTTLYPNWVSIYDTINDKIIN